MSHISDVRQGDICRTSMMYDTATSFRRKLVVCNEFMQTQVDCKELRSIHPSSSDSKCRCVISQRLMTLYEVLKVQYIMELW